MDAFVFKEPSIVPARHLARSPTARCDSRGIHRSIAACHAHIARGDNIHALTAALMLPCYQAGFCSLVRELDAAQASELMASLDLFAAIAA
jgi:hypothetical protein